MEQVVVALSPFTRRSRSFAVSHVAQSLDHGLGHGLEHGLDLGEHVLVHDPASDEHFMGVVADVHFELEDTTYRVELGGRITAAEAAEWQAPRQDDEVLSTGDIVALLNELRRGEQDISAALAGLRAR
ncbi:MAG TPA: hypothetical protein VNT31_14035 [Nocardioides sp.]|nr:hypothetical protein [Nocardioides sp.]